MERNKNKENISDRTEKQNSKSLLSPNIPLDLSHNSLLSSKVTKKTSDKKNSFNKPTNITTERSLNKRNKKQLDDDSYSLDNSKYEVSKAKKNEKKKIDDNKNINNKIIVDDIQSIYSSIANKSNNLFFLQKSLLLIIACLVNVCHWLFLFINIHKLERNYCYTNLDQFESCSTSQICENFGGKVNIILFNNTLNVHNNSKTFHQNFLEEFNIINDYYKPFFVNHHYQISRNRLYFSLNMNEIASDKINMAIILSKKENWNIFYKFYSVCQKDFYFFWASSIIVFGGCIGSIIFGILADLFGRKKLICFNLFIGTLSTTLITALTISLENKYNYYLEEYEKKYYSTEDNNKILSSLYAQQKISEKFEKSIIKYFTCMFLLCFTLRPLGKISLALLLEDSSSELKVLENFRRYTFVTTGIPPFLTYLLLVTINDFSATIILINSLFFICFVCSFFYIHESLRWHYEYCEWKELTIIIKKLFKIKEEESTIHYKNKIEFEAFRYEENRKMIGNFQKKVDVSSTKNTIFNIFKKRIISLRRDIRRNSEVIIRKNEVQVNPLIIYTCLTSNRVFNKSKYLFLMLLIIIYTQVHFVEKELVDAPFFQIKDIYFDFHNCYFINSNYFILLIITFISNFIYYMFHRISCFKFVLFISLIIVTILLILYYYLSDNSIIFPLDLNLINFNMVEQDKKYRRKNNTNILILIIYFLLNGINFYINLLILKLSKTIYRCSLFGINSFLALLAFAFGESLNYQIEHNFFLIGSLNIVGVFVALYFGELKTIPYIINDVKQNLQREKKN